MSDQAKQEREDQALEALIISQLRVECGLSNVDDLPELTEAERVAMNKLPADLIERLWNVQPGPVHESPREENVLESDLAFAGMNRAEAMEEETRKALEEKRKEVFERLLKKRKQRKET